MPFSASALDRTFAALAHPIRRAILAQLAHHGAASVTALAKPFDVSLMAVSKHVRALEDVGLVTRRKEGRVQRCRLSPQPLEDASEWIQICRRI